MGWNGRSRPSWQMIRDAGFDGAGVDFADLPYTRKVTDFLRANGMIWHAMCNPRTVDELKPIIANVQELGADHINLQPNVKPYTLAECIPYLDGWRRLGVDGRHPGPYRNPSRPDDDRSDLHPATA